VPRPIEFPEPNHLRVAVVDYIRHGIASCAPIVNHADYRRFTMTCGLSVDVKIDDLARDPRFDQSDLTVTCFGCGGT
jgi:hypothetical protein